MKVSRISNEFCVIQFSRLSIISIQSLCVKSLNLQKIKGWSERCIPQYDVALMLKRRHVSTRKLNLKVLTGNQVTFGEKILKIVGAKIRNDLPYKIKPFQSL